MVARNYSDARSALPRRWGVGRKPAPAKCGSKKPLACNSAAASGEFSHAEGGVISPIGLVSQPVQH